MSSVREKVYVAFGVLVEERVKLCKVIPIRELAVPVLEDVSFALHCIQLCGSSSYRRGAPASADI